MKLTKIILVVNDNPLYYQFANDIYDIWEKRIKIPPHLFVITNNKQKLKTKVDFGNRRVQYIEPVPKIPTAFQSQVIRLLLPCLYINEYSLISDIDMIPIQKNMFKKIIKYLDDDIFVQYFQNNQICYNCAKGSIWRNIFKIKTTNEMKKLITEWYKEFKGSHTTDQEILQKYMKSYNKPKIILTSYLPNKTLIKRLSTYTDMNIISKIKVEDLDQYIDFHAHGIFNDTANISHFKNIIKFLLRGKINEIL